MARLLVDTDVFIDHIRGRQALRTRGQPVHYSTITRAELWAGGNEAVARTVLEPFTEIAVTRAIAERAGRVRRATGIALPDALIAASALDAKLILVTRKLSDFERVPKLTLRAAP